MSANDESGVQVSVEQSSPVQRLLTVTVEDARVKRAFRKAYTELGRRARVRGFRPGKVPMPVLERLYGGAVAEDLERTLVAETLPQALEQSELEPVTEPMIDAPVPRTGEAFTYTVRVEVKPRIELPELEGLPARKPRVEVAEDVVQGELERLRQHHASLVEEAPETPAAEGHVLTLDFEGRIDGQPFEGGRGREVAVEIGSGRFLPGFEEQLCGALAGQEREIRVTFPEDYAKPELAGREAVFQVRVSEVKRREIPELDDEFAKDLGDFASLADLRERVREDLRAQAERQAESTLRRTLLDALIERSPFEVPPGLVERRLHGRLSQAHGELEKAVPEEALHEQLARWREEWHPHAEREVREELLLEAVARLREIEIDDEALDQRLGEMAARQGVDPARLRKRYREAGVLEGLRARLAQEAALDFLVGEAKVEETTDT